MKKSRQNGNIRKKYKGLSTFTGFLLGMYLVTTVYLIYNLYNLTGIENIIRYVVMGALSLISIFIIIKFFTIRRRTKLWKYLLMILIIIILGGAQFFAAYTISKGLNVVNNISTKKYKTYKTSLVALSSGKITKIADITSSTKIGRVSDTDDIENNVLSEEIMTKNKISDNQIVDYDDPITLLYELYEGKVDAAFISGSYGDIYRTMQKFENIDNDLIELDSYSEKMKVKKEEQTSASGKIDIDKPFTMLLMGVDSTAEDISKSSGLGDSLMVITFNPKTLNATILSIPRDTFVQITCYRNVRSKITHAASGGDKCMINTIQQFLDVNIDYYVKINFRGLVKIVDAVGGIDVDVPYAFCEQNSLRQMDNGAMIYVNKGWQHLDGEQALALSRNRKTVEYCSKEWNRGTRNDFVRGQNQQLVINAIINKIKALDSLDKFYALLDAVGGSMVTNMDRKQILSFYNLFKKILVNSSDLTSSNNLIDMQKMYLNGRGALIQDGIMSSMNLYEYVPSTQSLNAIIKAMKQNLELVAIEPSLSFSFSADKPYEQKVIGSDLYGGVASYPTVEDNAPKEEQVEVKDFKGSKVEEAKKWCSENGIYFSQVTESVSDSSKDGIIISQDATGTVNKGVTIKFTVGKYGEKDDNSSSGNSSSTSEKDDDNSSSSSDSSSSSSSSSSSDSGSSSSSSSSSDSGNSSSSSSSSDSGSSSSSSGSSTSDEKTEEKSDN